MPAIVATVALAFTGYLATYLNSLRLTQRQERLERVNRQLSEFYGPLIALTESNRQIFDAFAQGHVRPDGHSPFQHEDPPTDEELTEWRIWFTSVFLPNIKAMRDIAQSKADLLVDSRMPPVLLLLCAHVAGYEVTVARWEAGDYTEHLSVVAYPEAISEYAVSCFERLAREQAALLGQRRQY